MTAQLQPLLQATHQRGKLRAVGFVAGLGVAILLLAGHYIDRLSGTLSTALLLLGTLMAIVGCVYGLRSISCPRCGAKWLASALGEMPVGSNFVGWLTRFERCPKCQLTSSDIQK